MTRFPLRVTERIKMRRKKDGKKNEDEEEEKRRRRKKYRGVYPKGITLTLVYSIHSMIKLT